VLVTILALGIVYMESNPIFELRLEVVKFLNFVNLLKS
jgi:hypothetical protein